MLTSEINLASCIFAHVSVFYKLTYTKYTTTEINKILINLPSIAYSDYTR